MDEGMSVDARRDGLTLGQSRDSEIQGPVHALTQQAEYFPDPPTFAQQPLMSRVCRGEPQRDRLRADVWLLPSAKRQGFITALAHFLCWDVPPH